MKPYGVTSYGDRFHVWRNHLQDEMGADTNPMLWFGKCNQCRDMIVCGLKTKTEVIAVMEDHHAECGVQQ